MSDQYDDKAREIVARELAAYYVSPRPQDPGSEPFDLRAAIAQTLRDAARVKDGCVPITVLESIALETEPHRCEACSRVRSICGQHIKGPIFRNCTIVQAAAAARKEGE